ncbi:hypothetical protein HHK36_027475 [Tetracentron sinense]|uniref:glucan endo-1,3-beta-D-glucosidase n=1 Tax=Tetracentron sinense TaxID=13715 RepID=A0A835D3K6_TETSI|nr:hypothetical protein HHK36_027475 [Tetracentron sinense]
MEKTIGASASVITGLSFLLVFTLIKGVQGTIGVNYGTIANDLPPPAQVARFLLQDTVISQVRLFDANPDILRAFAHTDIAITVTVPNEQIPHLTKVTLAQQWVKANVLPYTPSTNIVRILVGNEVLSTANRLIIGSLVPAMQNLHTALVGMSLDSRIKVSTPHSLGILSTSSPPSTGKFRQGYDTVVLKPLLSFLRATNAPFMINPYPFFGCSAGTLDYALFRPNAGAFDENTQLMYTNMLDGQLDAIFTAMKLLGYGDVDIVIAETGWPSIGDSAQIGVDANNAAQYNGNLMRHVTSGLGTPLMPNRTFEAYIFSLFNENLKPGPTCERNFGLFRPDMTPVYDIGILRPTGSASLPINPAPVEAPVSTPLPPAPVSTPLPPKGKTPVEAPVSTTPLPPEGKTPVEAPASTTPLPPEGKKWCVPKSGAKSEVLQNNIDYVCGLGFDCRPIQAGGACFFPNTVQAHAAYAMNVYYQVTGLNVCDCDFRQTGAITTIDPSNGSCKYG